MQTVFNDTFGQFKKAYFRSDRFLLMTELPDYGIENIQCLENVERAMFITCILLDQCDPASHFLFSGLEFYFENKYKLT